MADQGKRRGGVPFPVQCPILTNMKAGYPGPAHVDRRGRASNRSKLHLNEGKSTGMDQDVNRGMRWDGTAGMRRAGTCRRMCSALYLLQAPKATPLRLACLVVVTVFSLTRDGMRP